MERWRGKGVRSVQNSRKKVIHFATLGAIYIGQS